MQNAPAPETSDKQTAASSGRLIGAWRRALLGAAGAAAMMLASSQVTAQDAPPETAPAKTPAVQITEVGALIGSYHTKNRGYYEGGVYTRFNEVNPGLSAKFHIAAAPKWLRDVQVGYIARNSYGDATTFIAVENTVFDTRHVRLTALTGVFPTGYNDLGGYHGPKPLLALAVEGQGRLSVDTPMGRLKPYIMAMPGGTDHVPVVLAGGIKLALK
ncbi:MAG: hypothetical protein Q8K65_00245 [Alphaproteobacteria bacterium]|nr:hypothetical protein [Alphaproteobacteria bacterium]